MKNGFCRRATHLKRIKGEKNPTIFAFICIILNQILGTSDYLSHVFEIYNFPIKIIFKKPNLTFRLISFLIQDKFDAIWQAAVCLSSQFLSGG